MRSSSAMKRQQLVKVSNFLFIIWFSSLVSPESVSDNSILIDFKNSISDPSGILASWISNSSDHCSWLGISCDSNSRVLSLNVTGGDDFKGNSNALSCSNISHFPFHGFGLRRSCLHSYGKLSGKLSSLIAKLTELRILSLPYNDFSGEIPEAIWDLEKLEVLDLEGNSFIGTLPLDFTNLRKLRVLNVAFNQMVGEIPFSLSKCMSLQVLNLAGNQINGTIPGYFGGLPELQELYLSFNRLTGSIPNEFGNNCGYLEHVDLSGNFLIGGIPSNLGSCSRLRTLLLFSNLLDDVIPPELGQLKNLEVLDVSRNSLSGPIPPELGNCRVLSVLVLSNLFNPLPINRSPLTDEYNYFQGSIPLEITTLPKLKLIWAPRATLGGEFPSNWGDCESLEMVNLAQNHFDGETMGLFGKCKKLVFVDLSSNKLTGKLDEKLPVPSMTVFDVSENHFSGSIPSFEYSFHHLKPSLSPSYAYQSFFTYKTQLEFLFPFSDGRFIIIHNFGQNNFTGPLPLLPIAPEGLKQQKNYAFIASGNKLNGSFSASLFGTCNGFNGLIFDISHNELFGPIPSEIGAMCKSLKFLDISENHISGSIPKSIGDLESLLLLDMSGNNLTGLIPSTFGKLHALKVLKLSSNSLSGEIPSDLVNLKNLTVLELNNNKFSGRVPSGWANVTALSALNVSLNDSVSLPLPSANVHGNSNEDSQNYTVIPTGSDDSESGNNSSLNPIEIASVISGSAILFVLLALIIVFFFTRKWTSNSRIQVQGYETREIMVFNEIGVPITFENVIRATSNFNMSNCIGNGGFGSTYKAEISQGILVAVKRLSIGRFTQGVQQFHAEIKTLGRIRHPNLVTLIGYHASEAEMFLIYNYLPGGNLERFINERSTRDFSWKIVHKIALHIACALAYLHDQCVPRVLHRDVKPSNILLDNEYNAYLSDFGLSRLLGNSETHATTGVAGTFGYVAPEYAMTCRLSEKADVYSYGVVLLELISDKKALDPSFSSHDNGFTIVSWASLLLREGRGKEVFTSVLWEVGPHDSLVGLLYLALKCTVDSLTIRPTMKQVVQKLQQIQPPTC